MSQVGTRRVSIMLESDLEQKIRIHQANLMKEKNETVTFSSVVNDILRGKMKI